jgi:biotin operon repressor
MRGRELFLAGDQEKKKENFMKAKELDKRFDDGQDISRFLDISRAKRTNQQPKRVNVDFPTWMIHSLDKEADRLGVTRQSIIKIWISERLKAKSA